MLLTTEGRIHLLDHELLKFLHNLRQAEPLDSWQKCKDSAAHLHQQQVHPHLREQARVQHLPERGTVGQRRCQESTLTQPGLGPHIKGEPGQLLIRARRNGPNTQDAPASLTPTRRSEGRSSAPYSAFLRRVGRLFLSGALSVDRWLPKK